jgi:hypothetical protein
VRACAGGDGGEQARRIGHALAGEVQGRAMVDGHARIRQAQGEIHRLFESAVLQHRQSLVVVHREYGVDLAQLRGKEGGISGQRAQ